MNWNCYIYALTVVALFPSIFNSRATFSRPDHLHRSSLNHLRGDLRCCLLKKEHVRSCTCVCAHVGDAHLRSRLKSSDTNMLFSVIKPKKTGLFHSFKSTGDEASWEHSCAGPDPWTSRPSVLQIPRPIWSYRYQFYPPLLHPSSFLFLNFSPSLSFSLSFPLCILFSRWSLPPPQSSSWVHHGHKRKNQALWRCRIPS